MREGGAGLLASSLYIVYNSFTTFFFFLQAAWTSFHNNKALSRKYMATYHIGHIVEEEKEVRLYSSALVAG